MRIPLEIFFEYLRSSNRAYTDEMGVWIGGFFNNTIYQDRFFLQATFNKIRMVQVMIKKRYIVFYYLTIDFVLVDSADPEWTLHCAEIRISSGSSPKYRIRGSQSSKC